MQTLLRHASLAWVLLLCGNVATARPNILLIVSDDQGYNDLGLLNPDIQTPHLDQLASEGVRLTNFYVTWPACTPSRGSLLTGRYPQRNGLLDMIRNEGIGRIIKAYKFSHPSLHAIGIQMIEKCIELAFDFMDLPKLVSITISDITAI